MKEYSRRHVIGGALAATIASTTLARTMLPRTTPAKTGVGARAQAGSPAPVPNPLLREIPATGEKVPAIGVGSFETFDIAQDEDRSNVGAVIDTLYKGGGRLIDTSPLYGMSEVNIGDFLTKLDLTDNVFISNKIWATGRWLGDPTQAQRQLERSMERLWRPQIDLLQVHSLTNAPAVLKFLRQWKSEGLVRLIGVTHWRPEFYDSLERIVGTGAVDILQVNYSIFSRGAEERLLPLCRKTGTGVIAAMPLEKARLHAVVEGHGLPDWAADFDCTSWSQFFLKYVISHPALTCAIPATSRADHMAENLGAMRGRLPDEDQRRRMVRHMESLPRFARLPELAPYPGKNYGGVVDFPL